MAKKSRLLQAAVGSQGAWIDGSVTPFGLYRELYRNRDELVVLDDVDGLYRDRAALRLLKCVCQTEPVKRVAWYSDAATLRREGILHIIQYDQFIPAILHVSLLASAFLIEAVNLPSLVFIVLIPLKIGVDLVTLKFIAKMQKSR